MPKLAKDHDTIKAYQAEIDELEAEINALDPEPPLSEQELWSGYDALPVARVFHESGARFKTILAGVQSGKSFTAVREFIKMIYRDRAERHGPLQYWAVAPSFPLTRRQETLIRQFLMPLGLIVSELKSERIIRLVGDITIQFKSGNNPDLLVAEPVNGMWVDEAARMKMEAWRDNLEGRTTATQGWHLFTTSSKGRNWFYTMLVKPSEEGNSNYFTTSWRTEDNVAVPEIVEECARKKKELPAAIYRREYEADLDAFEGQIYNEWTPSIHIMGRKNILGVLRHPEQWPEVMYGFDPAFGHAGCLIVVIRAANGTYYVVDEVCAPQILQSYWSKMLVKKVKQWGRGIVYCDPSGADYIAEFRSVGIVARKAYNDVLPGIKQVATAMHPVDVLDAKGNIISKRPNVFVGQKCQQLIKEIPLQRWGADEHPFKQSGHQDDAVDAFRYSIARKGVK